MATKAEDKRARFKAKAVALGYQVTRIRPAKRVNGVVTSAQSVIYSVIDDPLRAEKEREFKSVGSGDNQANDGFKVLLFPWDSDVLEGDELRMVNTLYSFNVTKADNPFMIGSQVVYWQVQATRKAK